METSGTASRSGTDDSLKDGPANSSRMLLSIPHKRITSTVCQPFSRGPDRGFARKGMGTACRISQ
jgi:hypothetical protein